VPNPSGVGIVRGVLSAEQVDHYRTTGFLVLEKFTDTDTVDELRLAYGEVLGRAVDAGANDRMLGGITRQVMRPSDVHPVFADNAAFRRGVEIATEVFGTDRVGRGYDMLIFKAPGHPHETPWHQDWAYAEEPFTPAGSPITGHSIQFWVALDDADAENGCMHFVAGHHQAPLLPHCVASGEDEGEARLLELIDPARDLDLSTAVCAEIPAGGCTMHDYGTPHYTPPNRSATRPRRAYIFNIGPTP
jgi:hypothetical protein